MMIPICKSIPEREPGYHIKEFEENFEKMLQAKKTGNKIKRKVFRFEETESSEEEEKSEAILNVE